MDIFLKIAEDPYVLNVQEKKTKLKLGVKNKTDNHWESIYFNIIKVKHDDNVNNNLAYKYIYKKVIDTYIDLNKYKSSNLLIGDVCRQV